MNALVGKPIKAFIYQDHQAHIATHQAFMQDPSLWQSIGQNPAAQQIMAALQCPYRRARSFPCIASRWKSKLGVPLTCAKRRDARRDRSAARAVYWLRQAIQLTQENQAKAAQAAAQQKLQDPIIQMQQAELQLKQAEQQRKAAKDQADAAD